MTTLLGLPAHARLQDPDYADVDMSWVAMTTDRDLAEGFAERWSHEAIQGYRRLLPPRPDPWGAAAGLQGGSLYRVEPIGATTVDPDLPNVSIRARQAVIVAVEIARLPYTQKIRLSGLRQMFWDDGNPMYTADGHGSPSLAAEQTGITPADLHPLGIGPTWREIDQLSRRLIQQRGREGELRKNLARQSAQR